MKTKDKVKVIFLCMSLLVAIIIVLSLTQNREDFYKKCIIIGMILFISWIYCKVFYDGKKQYEQSIIDNEMYHKLESQIEYCNKFLKLFPEYIDCVSSKEKWTVTPISHFRYKKDQLLSILPYIPELNIIKDHLDKADINWNAVLKCKDDSKFMDARLKKQSFDYMLNKEGIHKSDKKILKCQSVGELINIIYCLAYRTTFVSEEKFSTIRHEIYPYIEKYYDTIIYKTSMCIDYYENAKLYYGNKSITLASRVYSVFAKVEKTQDAVISNAKNTKEIKEGLEKIISQKDVELEIQKELAYDRKRQLDEITYFLHDLFASCEDNVAVTKEIMRMLDSNDEIDWKEVAVDKTADVIVAGICGVIKAEFVKHGIIV